MTYSSHWGDNGQYLPYWRAPRLKCVNDKNYYS
jgi:hypothetical protein